MELRYERLNPCAECGECSDGERCAPARMHMRRYNGLRFTSDGFDCALPVALDSHGMCSYGCLYCFSDNLVQHRDARDSPLGQQSLQQMEKLFAGQDTRLDPYRKALRYDRRNEFGYPCAIQLGALTDPCDHIERQQGWLLDFIELAVKYSQPVRMSTKGTVLDLPEYQLALSKAPELFWVAFSISSIDDELLSRVDRRAPTASERLRTMGALSAIGVNTSLRMRPILPGLTDSTPNHPHAYKELIQRSAAAGARAISYEVGFLPGRAAPAVAWRWQELENAIGVPLRTIYKDFGPLTACSRPAYGWTEHIMHAIKEEAQACGLDIGISDPVWKQLGECGCCCGIPPDDIVFGNWEQESATNQLLLARDDPAKLISPRDITPAWAYDVKWDLLVNPGVGPQARYKRKHWTWADELQALWNDLHRERNPLHYFQGALVPVRRDHDGGLLFRYEGLQRNGGEPAPYWNV